MDQADEHHGTITHVICDTLSVNSCYKLSLWGVVAVLATVFVLQPKY